MSQTPRTKIRCKKCNDIICSPKNGELVFCSCGACYIDQNDKYYTRIGGNKEDWEKIIDTNYKLRSTSEVGGIKE